MPIYEYECPQCQEKFEQFKPIYASDEDVACLKCGADAKRIISKTASGSGFGCGCGETRRTTSFG
jgi:putative FmdB family regulatory protein